ncbi:MAG: AEC family transporter [Maritimibacter sp.]
MTEVLLLMLPIFTMIAIGSLFVWRGWFPTEGLSVLNKFVMNACIPALLFSAITNGESLSDFSWLNSFTYAAGSLGSVVFLWALLRYGLREAQPQSVILALGGATANTIFLGFPIASAFIPGRAAEAFAWVVFAEVAIIMPLITTLALLAEERHDGNALSTALKALFRSPVVLGLVAGFAFLATGLSLPAWGDQVVTSIVSAAPFVALFVIGGSILQFRMSRSGPRVLAVTLAKLVVHPLVVGIAFWAVFGWAEPVTRDAILFACMPLFLSFVAFCGRHSVGDVGASAIVMSTLIGALTVPVVLGFLF